MKHSPAEIIVPGLLAVVGVLSLVWWTMFSLGGPLEARVAGLDGAPAVDQAAGRQRPVVGEPIRFEELPSKLAGSWPWFRGERLDLICDDGTPLARQWPEKGPPKIWHIELGQGYAAAAISNGRVYVLDYDEEALADTMRCLSLDNGKEIWRNSYPVEVAWNHGMSRTIPAVVGEYVISFGPQCHVVCWNAETGQCHWLKDLVLDYGATVPKWYAGQCPLIDTRLDRLILAPGGEHLLIAVDYRTGDVIWESGNPGSKPWEMSYASIAPMEFEGRRLYVYCGTGGVAGVAADDGSLLWHSTRFRNSVAMSPSPVVLDDGRIFLSSGYKVGSMMLQLNVEGDQWTPEILFELTQKQFGSEQQTPVLFDGHLYGVRKDDGKLICLDLDGKELWNSGEHKFGSAPYMIADGLIYVMDDDGMLTMAEATPKQYQPLARAQVIDDGHHAWGPMAMVAGRLIVRDMTRMVCLDVARREGN